MSALSDLVRRAVKFANWAAGEGICPSEFQSEDNPDEFLFAYSSAMDDDDWDTLADRIGAHIEQLENGAPPHPPPHGREEHMSETEAFNYCSFCGKHKDYVAILITGPACCICDECVGVSSEIVFSWVAKKTKEARSAESPIPKRTEP